MIPPLAWLLFLLTPVGGVLLALGIRTVRRSFLGPIVAEMGMEDGRATFEIASPGIFGLWCRWPMFRRSPLASIDPVVIDDATGSPVPLWHSIFRPHSNDGVTAWFEFRRFAAAAGRYRLELRSGSGLPTAIERTLHRFVPLPPADPARCAIQVRESQSAVWFVVGVWLLVLAGMLLIGGLVGGILVATAGRAGAAEPAPPGGIIERIRRLDAALKLDAETVSELLAADLVREDGDADAWSFFVGGPRKDGPMAADVATIDLRVPAEQEPPLGPLLVVDLAAGRGPTMADVVATFGAADEARPVPPGHPASLALAYGTPRGRLVFHIGPAPARQIVSIVIDRGLLSADRAATLARSDTPLLLDGLEAIDPDVAAALEPHRALLSLDRVRWVDAATAAALARHAGRLKMGGLEAIESDALFAKLLGDVPRHPDWHWFMQDELRSLTDAQAAAIAGRRFSLVMIPKAALTERQAGILADAGGEICVGADVIPEAALRRLAGRSGDLVVVARTLSDTQAGILAARRGPLTLHVVELADSAARILAVPAGPLKLTTGPDPTLP